MPRTTLLALPLGLVCVGVPVDGLVGFLLQVGDIGDLALDYLLRVQLLGADLDVLPAGTGPLLGTLGLLYVRI